MWNRVASWFAANATHATVRFLPDHASQPIQPYAGYLRLWLAEGFLARRRAWGANDFPALHGGVSLTFLGNEQSAFTTFSRPPESWSVPGAQLDFPMTTLLPFSGGTVEVEAALYRAQTDGPLGTAISLIGGLASLMGPPLSTAAGIAAKVSDGLDTVLAASGTDPVLALHATMTAPGAGPGALRSGYLAVLAAPEDQLAGTPEIHEGRLHLRTGAARILPEGVDYLVVRVECRTERDDWRFPELDALIRAAGEAFLRGHRDTYQDLRTDAIVRAWNSTDLAPADRQRVALLVTEEFDRLGQLGAIPGPERTLHEIASGGLPHRDDPRLQGLTLNQLVGS
jgi:hypothetical protein